MNVDDMQIQWYFIQDTKTSIDFGTRMWSLIKSLANTDGPHTLTHTHTYIFIFLNCSFILFVLCVFFFLNMSSYWNSFTFFFYFFNRMTVNAVHVLCIFALLFACVHSLPKRTDHASTLRYLQQSGLSDSDSRALLQAYILGKLSVGDGSIGKELETSEYPTIKRKAFWRPMGYLPFENHVGSGASSSNDNAAGGGSASAVFRYG